MGIYRILGMPFCSFDKSLILLGAFSIPELNIGILFDIKF